jgi:hypothetical protein
MCHLVKSLLQPLLAIQLHAPAVLVSVVTLGAASALNYVAFTLYQPVAPSWQARQQTIGAQGMPRWSTVLHSCWGHC